jgi:hypothetical protein
MRKFLGFCGKFEWFIQKLNSIRLLNNRSDKADFVEDLACISWRSGYTLLDDMFAKPK